MDPKKIEVNGREYQVIPATGMNAINLDRKVFGLWYKLDFSNDTAFMNSFGRVVSEMAPDEYEELLRLTFNGVSYVGKPGEPNASLITIQGVAEHFAEHKADLYFVMIEVWKANKLSPFA